MFFVAFAPNNQKNLQRTKDRLGNEPVHWDDHVEIHWHRNIAVLIYSYEIWLKHCLSRLLKKKKNFLQQFGILFTFSFTNIAILNVKFLDREIRILL